MFEAWDDTELLQVGFALEVHDIPFTVAGQFTPLDYGPTAAARIVRVPRSRFEEAREAIRESLPDAG